MDKKTKKRIAVLRGRLQNRERQLAGAKAQGDEPGAVQRLEHELDEIKGELDALLLRK